VPPALDADGPLDQARAAENQVVVPVRESETGVATV
jgi:hypothetical protein